MTRQQTRGWVRDPRSTEPELRDADWTSDSAPTTSSFASFGGAAAHGHLPPPASRLQPDDYGRHHQQPGYSDRYQNHNQNQYPHQDWYQYQPRFNSGRYAYQPDRFDDRPSYRYGRDERQRSGRRYWEQHQGVGSSSSVNGNGSYSSNPGGYGDGNFKQSYQGYSYSSHSYQSMPPAPQHSSSRHYYSRSSSQDYDGGDHFRSRSHQDRSSARPGSSRQGTPVRDTFKILPPRREYILYSCEPLHSPEVPVPKLLVLDLNGALVYRTERGGSPRVAYPRPFLANFLSYVFGNDPDGRGYEVLVWSSAQPHNVRNMVESTFEPSLYKGVWERESLSEVRRREKRGESRLLDVWARDKMGLSANAYGQKVQTVKDLRKVTNVYNMYSEKTTVLLDDSPLKAIHQPWSQVVIPEFDRPEFTQARSAAQRLWEEAETRGATTTALDDGSTEPEMDNILLGVIGILEAMRDVDNVPAWVRAGNLSSPEHPLQEVPSMSVTLADLPTHDTFVPWFKDGEAHKYWIERGKEALARRGIPVSHGLMPDGHGATSTRIEDIERVAERKRTATLERIAERTRTAELERMDGLDCARPDGSASQPIAIHSDVEEEDDDTSDDGTPKQTKKVSKRKLKKKAEKRAWKERVKLAEAKAQADAEAGVGDGGQARGAREDSVATVIDAPRDDLPPGIEPVPIVEHITGRKQDSTLGRAAVAPAPFYVQRPAPPTRHAYGTRSQSAAAKVTATAPADNSSPTFSPSPKPREREYSPSKPVY